MDALGQLAFDVALGQGLHNTSACQKLNTIPSVEISSENNSPGAWFTKNLKKIPKFSLSSS